MTRGVTGLCQLCWPLTCHDHGTRQACSLLPPLLLVVFVATLKPCEYTPTISPTNPWHAHTLQLQSPSVGRQPVTLDISIVEVRPRGDWPSAEVPRSCVCMSVCVCETLSGGQENQYSTIKTKKTMLKAVVGHNELTQRKYCCRMRGKNAGSQYSFD